MYVIYTCTHVCIVFTTIGLLVMNTMKEVDRVAA